MADKFRAWITTFLTDRGEYSFAKERFAESYAELQTLFEENNNETGFAEGVKLDPNYQSYFDLEAANAVQFMTVRVRGVAVGYALYILGEDTRHKGRFEAEQDMIFITKKHRGVGYKFIKYCDDILIDLGVNAIWRSTNNKLDISKMYERLGYKFAEKLYLRRID